MLNLIIKEPNGSFEVLKVDKNMTFKPTEGQQYYFDNYSGSQHTFKLLNGAKSIELIINDSPRITIIFEDMVDLINKSSQPGAMKTVLSIIDNSEGIYDLQQTVMNTNFKGDDIISSLKGLLADSAVDTEKPDGIVIDNFGALTEQLEAAAAGGESSAGTGFSFSEINITGNAYGADPRGTGTGFNDPTPPTGVPTGGPVPTPPTPTAGPINSVPAADADTNSLGEDDTSVGGNVLSNDDLGADTPTTVTGVAAGTSTSEVSSNVGTGVAGSYGSITINANGSYTYNLDNTNSSVQGLNDGESLTDTFTYTITDDDGDTSTTTVTITINGTTDVSVNPVTVTVDEDGLLGTTDDDNYDPDITVVTADLNIDVGNNSVSSIEFTSGQTTSLTSEGKSITLELSSDGKTITGVSSDGRDVFEISINESNETYTFKLLDSLDHSDMSQEDLISNLTFGVDVTDSNGNEGSGNINVNVADDIPSAGDSSLTVSNDSTPVNLVFTLDISGSMGTAKLQNAIDAIKNLVAEYEAQGNTVYSQLNIFSSSANTPLSGWMDSSTLSSQLDSLSSGGYTNYEAALEQTETNYTTPTNDGDTYVYFLSDGEPTVELNDDTSNPYDTTGGYHQDSVGGSIPNTGYLDADRLAAWNDFLTSNNIQDVYSVGIDMTSDTYLKLVSTNATTVDSSNLSDTLANTVVNASGSLNFSFGADGAADGVGGKADGDKLAFTWESPTATDANGDTIAITWTISSDGTLLTGTLNGETVIKVEATDIYTDSPKYKVTQLDTNSEIIDIKIPYTVTDGDGDSANASLDIFIGNHTPETTDDSIVTNEDTAYTLTLDDFGTYSDIDGDSLSKVKIVTLPEDGVLTLNGVEITAGTEVSVSDITSGKLVFTPDSNTDEDSSFTFQVSDSEDWSDTQTSTVEVIAVADTPTATISVTRETTIDDTNVNDTTSGYTVTAYDINGNETTISTISNTDHDGFGVTGDYDGSGGAADAEIAYDSNTGKSEKIAIEFENDLSSVDISIAWQNSSETVKIDFYKDGVFIESQTFTGASDKVDGYKFQTSDGSVFDEVVFSGAGAGDDYLIHEITATEVVTDDSGEVTADVYNVDISAALADTDGSETLTVVISGVPDGATLSSQTYTLTNNNDGTWTVTVPANEMSIADTIKMTLPSGTDDFNLTITARATETNDNDDGLNYAEATDSAAVIVPSAPTTTDDSISTNEDTSYTLALDDFGTYNDADGDSLSKVKITSLPTNGTLTLDGVAIALGAVIAASDISSGKLVFTPNSNTDDDSSFDFKVSDGDNWSSTQTTTVEVIAVADTPTSSIDVIAHSSSGDLVITSGSNTYSITDILANKDTYTELKNIKNNTETSAKNVIINENMGGNDYLKTSGEDNIIVLNGDFGTKYSQAKIEGMNGDDVYVILGNLKNGYINDSDGRDIIYLDKASSHYTWTYNLHSGNTGMDGTITQYDDYGNVVGTLGFNNIEGIVFADGTTVGDVQTTSDSSAEYTVDISAALADTDGSETLTVVISGVPDGATLSSDTYTLTDNNDGTWTVTVPANTTSITDSISMTVPSGTSDFSLDITARATETNDNTNGQNYAEATDSDAIVDSYDETNSFVFDTTSTTTNVVITLDVSGSMDDWVQNSDGSWTTRLALAQKALEEMINAYEDQGSVNVKLVTFNSSGEIYSNWMDANDAINTIKNLDANGSTNYEDAVYETYNNYSEPTADQTVAYFLSDGEPTAENKGDTQYVYAPYTDYGQEGYDYDEAGWLDSSYRTGWDNFVDTYVDNLYVIGVGSGINDTSYLDVLANAGDTTTTMVTDESELSDTLVNTATTQSLTGNIMENISGGDGEISIDSIQIDGTTYDKDSFPSDGVSLDGDGKLTFNFTTGEYTYSARSSEFDADVTKSFSVTASDEDGDSTTLDVNLKIDISPNSSESIVDLADTDTIDLSSVISANSNLDGVDMTNSSTNNLQIDLDDIVDLDDENNGTLDELKIFGDSGDNVTLEGGSDNWTSLGKEEIDGETFDVYQGTSGNSNIKILIDEDVSINPDF